VNEIQLAKGAIRAGEEILLKEAGIGAADLDSVVVAGAFGTYLDIESAIAVGLLVEVGREALPAGGKRCGPGSRTAVVVARTTGGGGEPGQARSICGADGARVLHRRVRPVTGLCSRLCLTATGSAKR